MLQYNLFGLTKWANACLDLSQYKENKSHVQNLLTNQVKLSLFHLHSFSLRAQRDYRIFHLNLHACLKILHLV